MGYRRKLVIATKKGCSIRKKNSLRTGTNFLSEKSEWGEIAESIQKNKTILEPVSLLHIF
jgi:hypothetical protein